MPSSNVCWGIEVGAGAIKALRVERDGDQLRVADFAILPHRKVLSTPELNKDDAVAVALGGFMSQYRDALKGNRVAVSIPGHSAFARFAKLPPVEKKGIANLVRFEAVQQIPFPIDDVEWDYQTFANEESPDIEVGIFAVTKAKIAEVLAQYGEQGLVPDIITLSPVAVYNALAYDLGFTSKTPGTVVLDIGATATDLIIAEAGKVWVRTFPLGGHNFTEALASTFKLTYGKAEKLKKEAETSKYKRHVFQALKPVLQELVQDVQRSISYYRDTHPETQITRLIGVGSTFKLIGLRKLLSQQLRMDVFRFERAKRLNLDGAAAADFEAVTPNMMTAYGLALQGLGLQTINANLMPIPVIRQAIWRRKTPWFVAAASIGLLAGGISFLRPFLDNMAVQRAKADSAVTRPISETLALGKRLKDSWIQASGAKQPGFVAENMRRLLEGRDLFNLFLKDLGGMFGAATEFARTHPEGESPLPAAEMRSYETQYLAPGEAFGGRAPALPVPGRTPQAPAGGAGGAEEAGGDASKAGAAGAVKFTLVFDSPRESLAFVNDSFLAWLRTNAQRAGVPYAYAGIPAATDLSRQVIVHVNKTDAKPAAPGRPGTPGPPGRQPPPEDDNPFGGRDGSNPSRPPSTPGAPPKPASSADLDKLAPLPATLKPVTPDGQVYRYTITWFAQIRPQTEIEKEQQQAAEAAAAASAPAPGTQEKSS